MKTTKKLITFPVAFLLKAEAEAAARGQTFSEFVRASVAVQISARKKEYSLHVGSRSGGDLSKYKSPETHARVCAEMREIKKAKQIQKIRENEVYAEAARRVQKRRADKEQNKKESSSPLT